MYSHITDPRNNKQYNIDSPRGREILELYRQQGGSWLFGSKEEAKASANRYASQAKERASKGWNWAKSKGSQMRATAEDKIAINEVDKYKKALDARYPVLLKKFVDAYNRFPNQRYKNIVVRDACETADYLKNNLVGLDENRVRGVQTCQQQKEARINAMEAKIAQLKRER